MNEWVMVGLAIIGTMVLTGGGAWVLKVITGAKNSKEKTS